MPHAITEDATNSDHSTGLPCPDNGETATWWGTMESARQQLADRTQALHQGSLSGDGNANKTFAIKLKAIADTSATWTEVVSSNHWYYSQTANEAGALWFQLEPLPPGATLVSVSAQLNGATFAGGSNDNLVGVTLPILTIYEQDAGEDTQIGTQTDPSATAGAFDDTHLITATVGVEIDPMKLYFAKLTGTVDGDGSPALLGMFVTLGPTAP
jgi:hypothetical protein